MPSRVCRVCGRSSRSAPERHRRAAPPMGGTCPPDTFRHRLVACSRGGFVDGDCERGSDRQRDPWPSGTERAQLHGHLRVVPQLYAQPAHHAPGDRARRAGSGADGCVAGGPQSTRRCLDADVVPVLSARPDPRDRPQSRHVLGQREDSDRRRRPGRSPADPAIPRRGGSRGGRCDRRRRESPARAPADLAVDLVPRPVPGRAVFHRGPSCERARGQAKPGRVGGRELEGAAPPVHPDGQVPRAQRLHRRGEPRGDIAHVSFHCPPIVSSKPSQKPLDRARLAAKILFAGRRQPTDIEYRPPGSEKLCAITKR